MKKAFDQTVRDLKRGVNKKVLKVPGIEQKVLDATSNEPWGPHGTLLADIAQATRNYHEYQMIMAVIWKRINDTGKNWRHVYKGLTVLEYLVAHGSERVIDDIREHAYQISTLSDFQYIDSSGRDQGNNVRRKSQSLVALVNDKERILEVRQKAAANRDKFRSPSTGGMYRPGGYDDKYDYDHYEGRYGSRDDDNGYGRERDYGYKNDDRYSRNGDSYGRDGDRYGRDYEDRYGRDGYRDDDYRGSNSVDRYQDGSTRSSDRNHVDDGQSSNRQLERNFSEQNIGAPPSYEEAFSESRSPARSDRDGENSAASFPKASSPTAPASSSQPAASGGLPPPVHPAGSSPTAAPSTFSPPAGPSPTQGTNSFNNSTSGNEEVLASDEFDPRNSFSAVPTVSSTPAPTTANSAELDLLGSLSDSFSSNALAIMPAMPANASTEADAQANTGSLPTFTATQSPSNMMNQSFDDPFGDAPFRAIPSADSITVQQPISASTASFHPSQNAQSPQPAAPSMESVPNFGDSLYGITYSSTSDSNSQPPSVNSQFLPQELSQPETDILADILPPSGPSPSVASQVAFSAPAGQPAPTPNIYGSQPTQSTANMYGNQPAQPTANMYGNKPAQPTANMYGNQPSQPAASMYGSQSAQPTTSTYGGFHQQPGSVTPHQGLTGHVAPNIAPQSPSGSVEQLISGAFTPQGTSTTPVASYMAPQTLAGPAAQFNSGNFLPHQSSVVLSTPQSPQQTPPNPPAQQNSNSLNNPLPQAGQSPMMASQPSLSSSSGALALVPQSQPSKEKFELKSAVWADTLSRGLIDLNISGSKTNPTADIGIDFDAINRKEKRMEKKPPQTQVTSNVTMGKAMGSGSGLGRTGASAIRPPSNPMLGSGMGMGMGPGMGMGMGMGGQSMGMGMGGGQGIGMGMGGGHFGMGMGMGMSRGQGMGMGMGGGSGMGIGSYGGMNQPMGMGMGMNNGMNMGVGMNMGIGQGVQMQPQTGMPPGTTMPGGYRPMTGTSGYTQQPYGGGYR
ncbi:clathrin interactor EPSIN 2-like [Mangifera indica]|uniref:clathrin interactor EPSIN 2-like n=1 Tax=Mangifera indica TaxID=29780 RepID=UPI001CF9F883|nr:clathrin interactor EPSIN 2-like [Mangifera indica]XP_044499809.1 clathrin interactor EPSIN 2-like [Mangifera indica]